MVYPAPDQKSIRIVRLLTEELIPTFGVPEALMSGRGTNLLSYLMQDTCKLLGIKELNITAYHSQCEEVERFNCTLKTMLRKYSGTSFFLDCCGHTAMSLMKVLQRNCLSYCLKLSFLLEIMKSLN